MPFSEDLTKKAQQVAGAAAEKAKDLAGTATEMAKAAIDTAKMNMEILSEQREIEKNYRAIGEWFVSEFQGEVPDAVKDVVAAVNASKEKIAQLEASKKKETAQEAEPVEESDDAKTCSVCGTVSDSNFCPHCGAPMASKRRQAAEKTYPQKAVYQKAGRIRVRLSACQKSFLTS